MDIRFVSPNELLKKADLSEADIISIKFNLTEDNVEKSIENVKCFLKEIPNFKADFYSLKSL